MVCSVGTSNAKKGIKRRVFQEQHTLQQHEDCDPHEKTRVASRAAHPDHCEALVEPLEIQNKLVGVALLQACMVSLDNGPRKEGL